MTDRIEGCSRLVQLLDEQIAAAVTLREVLTQEKSALTGSDVTRLNEIDTRKRAELSRSEQLESSRRRLCASIGISAERGAMDYLINDLAAEGHTRLQNMLRTRWQRLGELIAGCRNANEVNGMIAHFKQRQLLQVLGILRGGASGGVTYNPSGAAAQATPYSNTLAQV